MNLDWLHRGAKDISLPYREQALRAQAALTNPPGALGVMQQITVDFAGWQANGHPNCEEITLQAFCGHPQLNSSHWANEGDALPTEFDSSASSKHILNALAGSLKSRLHVMELPEQDSRKRPTNSQQGQPCANPIERALVEGYLQTRSTNSQLMVGIPLDSSSRLAAAEVYAVLLEDNFTSNPNAQQHDKNSVLLEILGKASAYEFAALIGAFIGAAQAGVPVLVNGFVATAAALLCVTLNPSIREWMLFTHPGEFKSQQHALSKLAAKPLLSGDLKGCDKTHLAVAVDVIRSALNLNSKMAGSQHPLEPSRLAQRH